MSNATRSRKQDQEPPVESDLEFPPAENGDEKQRPAWSRYVYSQGGRVEVALWPVHVDTGQGNGYDTFNVVARRSYFDKDERKWKPVKGFRLDDLPAIALLTQQAHAWALTELQVKE